eukprot:7685920-Lingulodinium_polyedra.AAC.1
MARNLALVAKTALWAPWWMVSALEGRWNITGAPPCPLAAVDGATIVAFISGRRCGPAPFRQRAAELTLAVSDSVATEAQGGSGHVAARDGSR